MRSLRKLSSRIPWGMFLALAVAFAGLALFLNHSILSEYRQKTEAAVAQPPRPVDLAMFRADRDIHIAGEVNLTAQVDKGRVYQVPDATGTEHYVITLMGSTSRPGDAPDAGLMLDQGEFDRFPKYVSDHFLSDGRAGPRIGVGGQVIGSGELRDALRAGIAATGQELPDDFFFVDPFFGPRVVVLAPMPTVYWLIPIAPLILALVFGRLAWRNWDSSPRGMYVALKVRQRWRRWVRASGVRDLTPAQSGHTRLFNPFVWIRTSRILLAGARRGFACFTGRCAACNRLAGNWIVERAAAHSGEDNRFAKLRTAADAPVAPRKAPDMFEAMRQKRRRAS